MDSRSCRAEDSPPARRVNSDTPMEDRRVSGGAVDAIEISLVKSKAKSKEWKFSAAPMFTGTLLVANIAVRKLAGS